MSKRLAQNLNSLYVEAANRLRPKKARRKIIAYVESYDDVFFGVRCSMSLRMNDAIFR